MTGLYSLFVFSSDFENHHEWHWKWQKDCKRVLLSTLHICGCESYVDEQPHSLSPVAGYREEVNTLRPSAIVLWILLNGIVSYVTAFTLITAFTLCISKTRKPVRRCIPASSSQLQNLFYTSIIWHSLLKTFVHFFALLGGIKCIFW